MVTSEAQSNRSIAILMNLAAGLDEAGGLVGRHDAFAQCGAQHAIRGGCLSEGGLHGGCLVEQCRL